MVHQLPLSHKFADNELGLLDSLLHVKIRSAGHSSCRWTTSVNILRSGRYAQLADRRRYVKFTLVFVEAAWIRYSYGFEPPC